MKVNLITFSVVYYDENDNLHYEYCSFTTDMSIKKQIDNYVTANSDKRIVGIYNETNNLASLDARRRISFEALCKTYGFEPDDFNKHIDRDQRIIGFLPKNHKYKVLLINDATNRYSKATISFVRKQMAASSEII